MLTSVGYLAIETTDACHVRIVVYNVTYIIIMSMKSTVHTYSRVDILGYIQDFLRGGVLHICAQNTLKKIFSLLKEP